MSVVLLDSYFPVYHRARITGNVGGTRSHRAERGRADTIFLLISLTAYASRPTPRAHWVVRWLGITVKSALRVLESIRPRIG